MTLGAKRMIPRGNESITIHHDRLNVHSNVSRTCRRWNEKKMSPSARERQRRESKSVRDRIVDRIGLIWIRTIVELDARTDIHTLRRCRWRTRLMIRKFKNRDPVEHPTPTSLRLSPSLPSSPSFSRTIPLAERRAFGQTRNIQRYSLIDRALFRPN